MRIIITLAVLLSYLSTYAQVDVTQEKEYKVEFNEEVGRLQYQDILEIDGETAQQLYDKVVRNYRQSGIIPDEKTEGKKLVVEINRPMYVKSSYDKLYYIVTINFKDGKARLLIESFNVSMTGFMGGKKQFKVEEAPRVFAEQKKKDKLLAKIESKMTSSIRETHEWLERVLAQIDTSEDEW